MDDGSASVDDVWHIAVSLVDAGFRIGSGVRASSLVGFALSSRQAPMDSADR
jgi:hypothetical protein